MNLYRKVKKIFVCLSHSRITATNKGRDENEVTQGILLFDHFPRYLFLGHDATASI